LHKKTGYFDDGYYSIYLDGESAKTLHLNESSNDEIYNVTYQNSDIIIKLENIDINTTYKFASTNDNLQFINIGFVG
jgi:hypothetical protein